MMPFIIITASSFKLQIDESKKFLQKIIKDKNLLKALEKDFPFQHPDILVIEDEKPNLGITLVRNLKKNLTRKPYQASQRIVLIPQAEKLTPEAQNALLKTLEEPPKDTIIILAVSKKEALLPTILSRAQIINKKTNLKLDKKQEKKYSILIKKILKASPGKRILLAENFSQSREEAIDFCQELLLFWHKLLVSSGKPRTTDLCTGLSVVRGKQPTISSQKITQLIRKTQETKQLLEKNINVRLTIEDLFLNL